MTLQAAENVIERSNFGEVDRAGAEARTHFRRFIGTSKLVPLEFLHFLSGSGGSKCLRRAVKAERTE
jgi:hypothetical protein